MWTDLRTQPKCAPTPISSGKMIHICHDPNPDVRQLKRDNSDRHHTSNQTTVTIL